MQTPSHSVASDDASTQLPLAEFFIGCIYFNDPLDRQASPSAHCNGGNASPPPADIATLCSPSSTSHASDGHGHTTAPYAPPQPPPGLEKYAPLCASHGTPVKAALVRLCLCTSISVTPLQPHVSTTQVGTHADSSTATCKRKCKYRPGWNPQSCWCRSPCRKWSFSLTSGSGSSHDQVWPIQT